MAYYFRCFFITSDTLARAEFNELTLYGLNFLITAVSDDNDIGAIERPHIQFFLVFLSTLTPCTNCTRRSSSHA